MLSWGRGEIVPLGGEGRGGRILPPLAFGFLFSFSSARPNSSNATSSDNNWYYQITLPISSHDLKVNGVCSVPNL